MATLLLVLIGAISLQVLCSAFSINPLLTFSRKLPLIGDALSLNSLLDFQWHLLVVIGLLPAGLVWLKNQHVRVDYFYSKLSASRRSVVDVIGGVVFALPFFFLIIPASVNFAQRAWKSSEGSRNNGLNDLWLIKSVLPVGMALLALAVLLEILRRIKNNHSSPGVPEPDSGNAA